MSNFLRTKRKRSARSADEEKSKCYSDFTSDEIKNYISTLPDPTMIDHATVQRLMHGGYIPEGGPIVMTEAPTELELPSTSYTAVMLLPLCINSEMRAQSMWWINMLIPQSAIYIISAGLQISFLFYVREMVTDQEGELGGLGMCREGPEYVDWYLRKICIAASVVSILFDMYETIFIIQWINEIPVYDEVAHVNIMEKANYQDNDFPFQKYKHEYMDVEIIKPAAGITGCYRIYMYCVGVIPKALISIALLWFGTLYVAYADSKEDIILNAIALTFILECDDLMFEFLSPPILKMWLAQHAVISLGEFELYDSFLGQCMICHAYLACFFTALFTQILHGLACS